METTVEKIDLLKILRENRDKHRGVFEAALEGYRKAVIGRLAGHIRELKDGRYPETKIIVPIPTDHTGDYDRTIKMLEMSIHPTYTLSDHEFGQFVMDDWDWKRQWMTTNSVYAAAEIGKAYG